jgi:hypothetical protein
MDCRELKNWGPDKRTLIVAEESLPSDKQSPPSLGDVRLIKVGKCPIDKDCVVVESSGNTSFCVYMRGYPDISEGEEAELRTLACVHPRAPAHSEVTSLIAYCPRNTYACIDGGTQCEHLENVLTPWQVLGPHYHVMCAKM